jgi:hypothetical protein
MINEEPLLVTRTLMLAAIVSHAFAIGLAVLDFAPEYAEYRRFAAFALVGIGFAASVSAWLTRRRLAGSIAWRSVVFSCWRRTGVTAWGGSSSIPRGKWQSAVDE